MHKLLLHIINFLILIFIYMIIHKIEKIILFKTNYIECSTRHENKKFLSDYGRKKIYL